MAVSVLERHFVERAAALVDCAALSRAEDEYAVWLWLRPSQPRAAAVLLYLTRQGHGTVALDDPACVPAELGEDEHDDLRAIDHVIDLAVDGAAVAYRWRRGGCVEESRDGATTRSWMNVVPLPGWRRRALRVDYAPYR
jgi:hypothetical protein